MIHTLSAAGTFSFFGRDEQAGDRDSAFEKLNARAAASSVGRQLVRGLLGGLLGGGSQRGSW
jgi:hypothetical protein